MYSLLENPDWKVSIRKKEVTNRKIHKLSFLLSISALQSHNNFQQITSSTTSHSIRIILSFHIQPIKRSHTPIRKIKHRERERERERETRDCNSKPSPVETSSASHSERRHGENPVNEDTDRLINGKYTGTRRRRERKEEREREREEEIQPAEAASCIKVKYRFYTSEPFNNFNERSSARGLLKEVIGDYSRRARSLTSNPRYF